MPLNLPFIAGQTDDPKQYEIWRSMAQQALKPNDIVGGSGISVTNPTSSQTPLTVAIGPTLKSNWDAGPYSITSLNSEDCLQAAEYGVVANGSLTSSSVGTDQTAAFLKALTAAVTAGKKLRLPSGVIKFTQNVALPQIFTTTTNVHINIEGAGNPAAMGPVAAAAAQNGGTILKFWTGAGVHGLTFNMTATATNTLPVITMKDLEVQGPDTDATATSGDGIQFLDSSNRTRLDLDNVDVNHFRGGKGFKLDAPENSGCRNISASYCDVGLSLNNASNANQFYNTTIQYCVTRGIELIGTAAGNLQCSGNSFFGGLVQLNLKTGIFLTGAYNNGFWGVWCESNNTSATAGNYGVYLNATSANTILQYNRFTNCQFNQSGVLDIVFIDASGGGNSNWNTIDSCYWGTTGPTVNSAACIGNTFVNMRGTLTDNGVNTRVINNNGANGYDALGAPVLFGSATTAPGTGISADFKGTTAFRAATGVGAFANGANNNINPGTGTLIVAAPGGAFSISGFSGGVDGRLLTIMNGNGGGGTMTLQHNNAGSSAGNKIFCPGGVDLVLNTQWGAAILQYASVSGAWYVISHN